MDPRQHDPRVMLEALERGGQNDLRAACDFADRIANAVDRAGDVEDLEPGFRAFRARNDYKEDDTSDPGKVYFYPLSGDDVCAPPKEKTRLGRFNAPLHPVLYLSTTREVALAESRALSTDTCTVAVFEIQHPIRLAKLLKKGGFPIDAMISENPSEESIDEVLLYQTAEFVSRRVQDHHRDLHYRTCCLIASAFKERDFDGLAYRTSFWSSGWREEERTEAEESVFASNIALFDPQQAKPIGASLFRLNWKRPIAEEDGGGVWSPKP